MQKNVKKFIRSNWIIIEEYVFFQVGLGWEFSKSDTLGMGSWDDVRVIGSICAGVHKLRNL
jgi:hypothetical protein